MKDAATDTANLIIKVDVCTQTGYEGAGLEESYDSDSTVIYAATASEETGGEGEYDSDATRLDSPTTDAIGPGDEGDCTVDHKEIGVEDHDDADSDSSGSYIETYTTDPTYDGPAYHSQPCSRHGVSYTPPGWKRIMVKRRKLEFTEAN